MKGNVIVGQSGGPTAAINASLAGVYKGSILRGANKVYGMLHGIQGFLDGKYIDLSEHLKNDLDIEMLKRTPSAYLGSCRFKLPDAVNEKELFDDIMHRCEELDIRYFLYIGGNDSMDTIKKLSDYAAEHNHVIQFVGVPKTIDNDLAATDHAPGYGSAAKYIATSVKEIIIDSISLTYGRSLVTVVEIMGRNAGWLTAAAALSRDEDSPGPDLIYLPEVPFVLSDFLKKVKNILKTKETVVVCVSEGIKLIDGRYVCELSSGSDYVDAFGHKQLSGTAQFLASYIASELGCKTRGIELGTMQRAAAHLASSTDIEEAFSVGRAAAKTVDEGETGKVVILKRISNEPYLCGTDVQDVHYIANDEKLVPLEWIDAEEADVKDEFIAYARPLIQGELTPIMINGLPRHLHNKEV